MRNQSGKASLIDIRNDTKKMKKNDGSSSTQLIRLDDDEEETVGQTYNPNMPKRKKYVMENKWKKE